MQEQPAPSFQDFFRNQVMANADAKAMYEKIAAAGQGAQWSKTKVSSFISS